MKGLLRSMSRAPASRAVDRKLRLVGQTTIEVDGATGVGFGSVVIGDLPEGNILILGAVAYVQATGPTSADLADTWAGDFGIGSTPAGDGTLTNADVDIIPSTALAAATAEASPTTRGVSTTATVIDNTDGSLEVNLSLLVDDANIGADDLDFTITYRVEILYAVLLDD